MTNHGNEIRSGLVVADAALETRLTRGASTQVWAAGDVVIKFQRVDLPRARLRFERELIATRLARGLGSVEFIGAGRHSADTMYLVTRRVLGQDLQRLVDSRDGLPPNDAMAVIAAVAGTLARVHDLGWIHGDVKPGNIMLGADGATLIDYGLARPLAARTDAGRSHASGTPLFLAPENITDPRAIGPASDIYSLGATAFNALVGHPPFTGSSLVEVVEQHLYAKPPVVDWLPTSVMNLVRSMMAKNPANRPTAPYVVETVLADQVALAGGAASVSASM